MTQVATVESRRAAPAGDEQAVLRARASRLARPASGGHERLDSQIAVLVVTAGGQRYGIEVLQVREVLASTLITRVPWVPPTLLGVTSVRGEILAVADAGGLLGVGPPRGGGPTVVLEVSGRRVGLVVDAIAGIDAVAPGALTDLGAAGLELPFPDLIRGLSPALVLLDAAAIERHVRLVTLHQEAS